MYPGYKFSFASIIVNTLSYITVDLHKSLELFSFPRKNKEKNWLVSSKSNWLVTQWRFAKHFDDFSFEFPKMNKCTQTHMWHTYTYVKGNHRHSYPKETAYLNISTYMYIRARIFHIHSHIFTNQQNYSFSLLVTGLDSENLRKSQSEKRTYTHWKTH